MFCFQVDFQKVQTEPMGCIPRSVDTILRNESIKTTQPGDCDR